MTIERLSPTTPLLPDERQHLAARPNWQPLLDRTAESVDRLLAEAEDKVEQMLGGGS